MSYVCTVMGQLFFNLRFFSFWPPQIEAGEGASTAIGQLEQEKVSQLLRVGHVSLIPRLHSPSFFNTV